MSESNAPVLYVKRIPYINRGTFLMNINEMDYFYERVEWLIPREAREC